MVPDSLLGFYEDYKTFLNKFMEKNDPSFPAFAEIWREMHFSLVYAGRKLIEAGIFATESFAFVKTILLRTDSAMKQIFNLYMLYGLFYKQPEFKFRKILVTHEEWLIIESYIANWKEKDCLHALYIIYKMIYNDVFEFSADSTLRTTFVTNVDNSSDSFPEYSTASNNMELKKDYEKIKDSEAKYTEALAQLAERGLTINRYLPENFADTLTMFKDDDIVPETAVKDGINVSATHVLRKKPTKDDTPLSKDDEIVPETKNLDKIICKKSVSTKKIPKGKLSDTYTAVKHGINVSATHVLRKKPTKDDTTRFKDDNIVPETKNLYKIIRKKSVSTKNTPKGKLSDTYTAAKDDINVSATHVLQKKPTKDDEKDKKE